MGSLYKQKSRDGTRGRIWWVKYYVNGRPVRESTGTEMETEAKRFLKEREGRAAEGQPIVHRVDRIRYEELAHDLRQHYEATGTRDLREFSYRVKHLDRFFAGYRAASIGQPEVNKYITARRKEGAVDSTIRRELGTVTKMLRLAFKNRKLLRPPMLEKPKEGPPREGFFEREQYEAVRRHLAPDLQVAQESPTRSAGGCRARSSCWSAVSSTSRRAHCGWIQAPPRTTRGGSSTCRLTSKPSLLGR